MSDYTDSVLAKFPDAPATIRKALAAALAAAEKAQQAKPGSTPIGESSLKPTGAAASETTVSAELDAAASHFVTLSGGRLTPERARIAALHARPGLRRRVREAGGGGLRLKLSEALVPPLPLPRGHRLIERRADVELAERSKARAAGEGITFAEAMRAELAQDPALRSRYEDHRSGRTALDELAYRIATIRSAAHAREHMTEAKAAGLALSEDPTLKAAVFAYFEAV
jgi:hypothetical protein